MKDHGGYCRHLEAAISSGYGESGKDGRLLYTDQLENFASQGIPVYEGNLYDDEGEMRTSLFSYGLTPKEIEIVIQRVIFVKPFAEIAALTGYKHRRSVQRKYVDILNVLKEKGYRGENYKAKKS